MRKILIILSACLPLIAMSQAIEVRPVENNQIKFQVKDLSSSYVQIYLSTDSSECVTEVGYDYEDKFVIFPSEFDCYNRPKKRTLYKYFIYFKQVEIESGSFYYPNIVTNKTKDD